MATDAKLQLVLTAKDLASTKLNTLSTNLGKVTGTLGKVAAGAAIAGVGIAAAFTVKSIKAAEDEQVAMAKVDSIVKTLSGSLEEHKKTIDDAANSAIQLGFDDEDAMISMAKFLQVTKDTSTAQLAMKDAMDIARLKGVDLETAAKMTTMAYAGNVKLLKEMYGIDLPEGTKGMEALGLMHDRVAGQAEAFGKTAAGAQERFKGTFENVQEGFGKIFLPIITGGFNAISSFLASEKLSQWIDTIGTFFTTKLIPAFRNLGKYLSDGLGPIFRDTIIPLWQQTYETLKPYIPQLKEIGKLLLIVVGGAILGGLIVLSQIVLGLATAFKTLVEWIKKTFDWIEKVATKAADFVKGIGSGITNVVKGAGNLVGIGGHALGGYVQSGRATMVGERGPELFIPSSSGSIVPNNQIGSTINVNFNNAVVRNDQDLDYIINEVRRTFARDSVLQQLGV